MEILNLPKSSGEVEIVSLLNLGPQAQALIDFGTASFPPGIRFPETGFSIHGQHEVSLMLEGELRVETPDGSQTVKAGQMIHLQPGEEHAATAVIAARVYYALFGAALEIDRGTLDPNT